MQDVPHNNLVLTIDPITGAAAIRNESPFFDAAIAAYTIASATGKLFSGEGDGQSLQDQRLAGWDEADNSSAFRLTEFNTGGPTPLLSQKTVLHLGTAVDVGGDLPLSDLSFEFLLSTGEVMEGVVKYGQVTTVSAAGDFDNDGDVDGNDLLVWQRTAGTEALPPGSGADGNGDGRVNASDLALWRLGFGTVSSGTTAAVPEPAGATLASMAALAAGCAIVRRSRRQLGRH